MAADDATVLLASNNAKKLAELQRILAPLVPGIAVLGLGDVAAYDEPVEDAPDFAGNALLKARAGFVASGLPTIADDSGLCVAALNEMPGVLSARWSGRPKSDERNNSLLLDQLRDVPDERRGAAFRCVIAFVHGAGAREQITVAGEMPGRVIWETRGEGGFGYDSLFVPAGREETSAQLTPEDKDLLSHRGRALRDLAPLVAGVLRPGH